MPVTFNHISGAEPSTVTFKAATVEITRNSSAMHQEIISLGDPVSSLGMARVLAAPGASTEFGVAVRILSGPSSLADFAVRAVLSSTVADNQVTATPAAGSAWTVRSSAANALVSVYQSTAADLNVTVAGYVAPSTTISISTVQGAVNMRSSAANALITAYQSTVTDFLATVNARDGSGNALESSTSAPSTGARGLLVRPVWGGMLNFASTNLTSTATSITSSAATTRPFVYAYSITTTIATAVELGFYAGSTLVWPIVLQAVSSAISGANLAVTPPGALFAGTTGGALTLNTSSTGQFKVGVAYWVST